MRMSKRQWTMANWQLISTTDAERAEVPQTIRGPRLSSAPTGLRHIAQGCERSELPWVQVAEFSSTPTGLRHAFGVTQPRWGRGITSPDFPRVAAMRGNPGLCDVAPLGQNRTRFADRRCAIMPQTIRGLR